jgi:hypothetical protein
LQFRQPQPLKILVAHRFPPVVRKRMVFAAVLLRQKAMKKKPATK